MLELSALLVVLAGVIYDGKACDFFYNDVSSSVPRCTHVEVWHPLNVS